MSNEIKPSSRSAAATSNIDNPELAQMLDKITGGPTTKGRLAVIVDATASRQPTWDLACALTGDMFRAAAATGGLEMSLVYYQGQRTCVASKWMSNATAISAAMSRVVCAAGLTQVAKALEHVAKEHTRRSIDAAVLITDTCEEIPNDLYKIARALGVPVFCFIEGTDEAAATIYKKIASLTGGAFSKFDTGSAKRLSELLRAVAAFAAGGREALINQNSSSARLLLSQLK